MASSTERSSEPFSTSSQKACDGSMSCSTHTSRMRSATNVRGVELDARLAQRDADVERLTREGVLHRREREAGGELALLPRAQLVRADSGRMSSDPITVPPSVRLTTSTNRCTTRVRGRRTIDPCGGRAVSTTGVSVSTLAGVPLLGGADAEALDALAADA